MRALPAACRCCAREPRDIASIFAPARAGRALTVVRLRRHYRIHQSDRRAPGARQRFTWNRCHASISGSLGGIRVRTLGWGSRRESFSPFSTRGLISGKMQARARLPQAQKTSKGNFCAAPLATARR